ncbi:MAG: putative integrase [Fervidicoccaceae archaeon]
MSTCPRCGGVGYRSVEKRGGRYYVYYIHRDNASGRVRKCYVGPVVEYDHAEKLHTLGLSNIEKIDYIAVARRAVELYVSRSLKSSERARAVEELEKLVKFINEKLELLKA